MGRLVGNEVGNADVKGHGQRAFPFKHWPQLHHTISSYQLSAVPEWSPMGSLSLAHSSAWKDSRFHSAA